MIFKKGLATLLVLVSMVGPSRMASPSSGRQQQQRGAVAIPAAAAAVVLPKKDGPNFDQQRLIALFGSEAQPVYGNRDPTTGRVVLAPSDPSNTGGSRPVYVPPPARNNQEAITAQSAGADADADADVDPDQTPAEEVDRKDTRVPETNEINPFELLPPQFHDLLNIPIHDYGNGTTYNPYDKYKVPSKSKYPLVSTGYANTKYQGSPNRSTIKPVKSAIQTPIKPAVATYDYDYQTDDFAPVKTNNQRPDKAKIISTTTTRTTTTATYDDQFDDQDDYSDHYPTTKKQRIPARQPETVAAVYRPNKHQIENTRKPVRPYDIDDDNNSQSDGGNIYRDQISTYRPAVVENRPGPETRPNYNSNNKRPEYRPSDNKQQQENRPAIRPSYPDYQDGQESDDWPKRPSVNRPDGFSPYKPINRPRPTTYDDHDNQQPSKPSYSSDDESLSPVFTPHQSYRPQSDDQIAEIKVTPKPFYAADDNQNYNQQQQQQPQVKTPGQVDDEPDIIYDYDDERSKGEGVMFMFDNGPSPVAAGPDKPSSASKPATASPPASPYPTVASRDPRPQPPFNPAFRPSAPVRPSSEGSFLSSPPSPQQQQQQPGLPIRNLSPQLPQQQKQQQQQPQFGNSEAPRPPFRFPADPVNPKENQQPPNILPLFRPNTNPTDEFQFIKHPQQIEFQRQQPNPSSQFPPGGQLPKRPVPAGQEIRQQQQQRPGGMSPLPSALQTPFSSISQAVANFFGRRSGQAQSAGNNQRSGDLNPSVKMDRSGIMDPTETESEFDLEMAESQNSGSFVLFSRPDQPLLPSPVSVDRSGLSIQHPTAQQTPVAPAATHPQVVGIRAAPDAASGKPPAFYVYTSRELEQGKPPYLVVGPVRSGPPNVAGAQLVHTAPAKPIPATPESQRRNDFPSGEPNSNRPPNLNSLPTFPVAQDPSSDNIPSARQPPEVVAPVRKPFFPISSGNKNERLPTGLSPPRQGPPPPLPSNNRRPPPGFIFPEIPLETEPVLPQGISPISQGIPPPRVPLNPQKDVASLFSNPTLLHNRPSEPFNSGSSFPIHPPIQKVTDQGLAIKNQPDPSVGVASIQNVNLYEETSTLRPLKRKTTKSPSRTTTTPIYMEAFNNKQPVTYATIQQEDGKQIAVVHPAYIVTYKSQPGPPELIDLDAPFVPSIESPTSQGELSSIPFEKWHAMPQEIKRQDDQITQQSSKKETNASPASSSSSNTELHSGFLPVVPDRK